MIQLPSNVHNIIETLENAGYEAYAVGGCVRDSLLGREPDDWDITTSALPAQVKELFRRTIDTGIQHGTVTVMVGSEGYEVTTYRVDGEYADGRHPNQVTFTRSLTEDLKRRDFTINAMAYSASRGIVDLFHGQEDLQKGIIRCVGDAKERFSEDALRMMRAVRFSAQLSFTIDEDTKAAISLLHENLRKVSAERIQVELVKTLVSSHPEYMKLMYETKLSSVFLPEFDICMETQQNNPHHMYSVGEHILETMKHIRADKVLRMSMLLHDIGKPQMKTTDAQGIDHFHGHQELSAKMATNILKRLKFDNDTLYMVEKFVRYHDRDIEPGRKYLRRAMSKLGTDVFPRLFEIKEADVAGQSNYRREEKLSRIQELRTLYAEVIERKECVSLKELAVTGADLIALGISPGKQLGEILNYLLLQVVDSPEKNQKEQLLRMATTYAKQNGIQMV